MDDYLENQIHFKFWSLKEMNRQFFKKRLYRNRIRKQQINLYNFPYFEEKIKQGIWQEAIDNYWSLLKQYEKWILQNNDRKEIDLFQIIFHRVGGQYNEQGMKYGKWIEQSDDFWIENQVTYNCECIDGKKYGLWNILLRQKYIGGGVYDKNGLKDRNWVDLSDGFCKYATYFYFNILVDYNSFSELLFKIFKKEIAIIYQYIILFFLEMSVFGMKDGNWVELKSINHKKFCINYYYQYLSKRFVTFIGNYMGKRKYGRWDIKYKGEFIGGGNYYENQVKNCKWIEISDSFMTENQIIYKVEYKNSQKFGKWNMMFRILGEQKFQGGSYDENGQKTGNWIELSDNFSTFIQITFEGEYLNGKKIQKRRTLHINLYEDKMKKIQGLFNVSGGGLYDNNGMKDGKWVEMFDNILQYKEFICNGKYNERRKQGSWDYKIKKKEYIGGGSYNQNGKKNGIWLELGDYCKEYEVIQLRIFKLFRLENIIMVKNVENERQCQEKIKKSICKRYIQLLLFSIISSEEFYDIANNKK
ncbi:unnamed protein product [Paramecium pentaurelia]|uniref:Uncharacterized protein n=1 Tax=Paramecium pentaurelia TaxID=43138 RepID=A0A8S1YLV0_9CILI|nr:unnamed protein product [Paramecium pentaurelia]